MIDRYAPRKHSKVGFFDFIEMLKERGTNSNKSAIANGQPHLSPSPVVNKKIMNNKNNDLINNLKKIDNDSSSFLKMLRNDYNKNKDISIRNVQVQDSPNIDDQTVNTTVKVSEAVVPKPKPTAKKPTRKASNTKGANVRKAVKAAPNRQKMATVDPLNLFGNKNGFNPFSNKERKENGYEPLSFVDFFKSGLGTK